MRAFFRGERCFFLLPSPLMGDPISQYGFAWHES
jgi:hypothetical protein